MLYREIIAVCFEHINVLWAEHRIYLCLTLWHLKTPMVVVPHRLPWNVAFYIFIQQIQILNILNMVYTVRFFLSLKCSLFHNSNVFGSSFIHILYTGCAKILKNNSGAKRLKMVVHKVSFRL